MKKILYTQRVEIVEKYQERRDCADQQIAKFILACGYLPIPIANIPQLVNEFVESVKPAGILLTGGNSLSKYGGDAPERDDTEALLIKIAIKKKIPVLGICRGMQKILDYFKHPLEAVKDHIAVNHEILWKQEERVVNSYHAQGVTRIFDPFNEMAKTNDGVIEAIYHKDYKIQGIMWHPEREKKFSPLDIEMIRKFFG